MPAARPPYSNGVNTMRWPGATGSNNGIFDTSDDAMSFDDTPSAGGSTRSGDASTFAQRFKSWEYSRDDVAQRFGHRTERGSSSPQQTPADPEGDRSTAASSRPSTDAPMFTSDTLPVEDPGWEAFEQQTEQQAQEELTEHRASLSADVELAKDHPLEWLFQGESPMAELTRRVKSLRHLLGGER